MDKFEVLGAQPSLGTCSNIQDEIKTIWWNSDTKPDHSSIETRLPCALFCSFPGAVFMFSRLCFYVFPPVVPLFATLGSGARRRRTRCGRALEARYLRRAFPRRAAYCWEPQTSLLCIESTEESHDSSILCRCYMSMMSSGQAAGLEHAHCLAISRRKSSWAYCGGPWFQFLVGLEPASPPSPPDKKS